MDTPGIISRCRRSGGTPTESGQESLTSRKGFIDPCRILQGLGELMQGSDPHVGLSFRAEGRQGAVKSAAADL